MKLRPMLQVADVAASRAWFETDDLTAFDALIGRVRAADVPLGEEPHWNPLAHHHEAALVDPDGYVVMLNSPFSLEDPAS
jgi:hypothetical protein